VLLFVVSIVIIPIHINSYIAAKRKAEREKVMREEAAKKREKREKAAAVRKAKQAALRKKRLEEEKRKKAKLRLAQAEKKRRLAEKKRLAAEKRKQLEAERIKKEKQKILDEFKEHNSRLIKIEKLKKKISVAAKLRENSIMTIKTKTGTVYGKAKITAMSPRGIDLAYVNGVKFLKYKELGRELKEKIGYYAILELVKLKKEEAEYQKKKERREKAALARKNKVAKKKKAPAEKVLMKKNQKKEKSVK
jgi:hypothetical protein